MSAPSARMTQFLQYLPAEAFALGGAIGASDRLVYSGAPPGTPPTTTDGYGHVFCRVGWRDQSWDKATVSFTLPGKGSCSPETFSICVKMSAWGQMPPTAWKEMILRAAPLGVISYPC